MSETNFTLSSQAQITPEEIEKRSFSNKVRGISESEVRSFLRRISDEITRLNDNETKLIEKVKKLEENNSLKHVASKAELLESLGEQTARILVGAEEAAEQMIVDAKELAANLTEKANNNYDEMCIKTDDEKELREKEIRLNFENSKKQANKNAEMIVENARVHGREIFQEATVLREKILKDLLRRRELLSEQIDELRKGREELLDSYKVVKGSFQKATDALVGVEEKASSELMANPIDVDELLAAHIELPAMLNSSNPIESFVDTEEKLTNDDEIKDDKTEVPTKETSSVNIISKDSIQSINEPAIEKQKEIYDQESTSTEHSKKTKSLKTYMKDALGVEKNDDIDIDLVDETIDIEETNSEEIVEDKKDVSELFKNLKTPKDKQLKDSVLRKTESDPNEIEQTNSSETYSDSPTIESESIDVKSEAEGTKPKKKAQAKIKTTSPIKMRDNAVAESSASALRKAKKQLQNEQNELLDSLRTTKSKKRLNSMDVLPSIDSHLKIWVENLREEIESVFDAGVKSISKEKIVVSEGSLSEIVNWIISPLSESLASSIDEGDIADVTTRVGAKYREWRSSDLKIALTDALCATYSHGVIAASPKGAVLNWIVPTGQTCAPAHSGCRCVIALS